MPKCSAPSCPNNFDGRTKNNQCSVCQKKYCADCRSKTISKVFDGICISCIPREKFCIVCAEAPDSKCTKIKFRKNCSTCTRYSHTECFKEGAGAVGEAKDAKKCLACFKNDFEKFGNVNMRCLFDEECLPTDKWLVGSANVDSLQRRINKVKFLLAKKTFLAFAVQETRPSGDLPRGFLWNAKEELEIEGYRLLLKSRFNVEGGGVGLYLNERIWTFEKEYDPVFYEVEKTEFVGLQFQYQQRCYMIGSVYRRPSSGETSIFNDRTISQIFGPKHKNETEKPIVIMFAGDLNKCARSGNEKHHPEAIEKYGNLRQHILQPTHENRTIDLFFTSTTLQVDHKLGPSFGEKHRSVVALVDIVPSPEEIKVVEEKCYNAECTKINYLIKMECIRCKNVFNSCCFDFRIDFAEKLKENDMFICKECKIIVKSAMANDNKSSKSELE